jgi:hypothetical protein
VAPSTKRVAACRSRFRRLQDSTDTETDTLPASRPAVLADVPCRTLPSPNSGDRPPSALNTLPDYVLLRIGPPQGVVQFPRR